MTGRQGIGTVGIQDGGQKATRPSKPATPKRQVRLRSQLAHRLRPERHLGPPWTPSEGQHGRVAANGGAALLKYCR